MLIFISGKVFPFQQLSETHIHTDMSLGIAIDLGLFMQLFLKKKKIYFHYKIPDVWLTLFGFCFPWYWLCFKCRSYDVDGAAGAVLLII